MAQTKARGRGAGASCGAGGVTRGGLGAARGQWWRRCRVGRGAKITRGDAGASRGTDEGLDGGAAHGTGGGVGAARGMMIVSEVPATEEG
jgi:hypothetical protein